MAQTMTEVPIHTLKVGQGFILPGNPEWDSPDKVGVVTDQNPGSTSVKVKVDKQDDFVPQTGKNAGQRIVITRGYDTTQWSRETMVIPTHVQD